jgi:hypothetical protein
MAGVATKKPGSDFGLQATFPTVFEAVELSRQKRGIPTRGYSPQLAHYHAPFETSGDIQGVWHQQKMEDAHRMAGAKVHSTVMMNRRSHEGKAGYSNMPKPSLVQRIFANPSLGSGGMGGDLYPPLARNVVVFHGGSSCETQLRGGVLQTIEGQTWGRNKLRDRVNQLNAIASAKTEFISPSMPMPSGPVAVGDTERPGSDTFGESAKVEFNAIRQSVMDSIAEGRPDALALKDLSRMLELLFRYAPSADKVEMEDILEGLEVLLEEMDEFISVAESNPDRVGAEPGAGDRKPFQTLTSMREFVARALEYARKMYAPRVLYAQPRTRVNISRSLVKQLGFSKLIRREGNEKFEPAEAEGAIEGKPEPPHYYRDRAIADPAPVGDEGEAEADEEGEAGPAGAEALAPPQAQAQAQVPAEEVQIARQVSEEVRQRYNAFRQRRQAGIGEEQALEESGLFKYPGRAGSSGVYVPRRFPNGEEPPATKKAMKPFLVYGFDKENRFHNNAVASPEEKMLKSIAIWCGINIQGGQGGAGGRYKHPKTVKNEVLKLLFGNAN